MRQLAKGAQPRPLVRAVPRGQGTWDPPDPGGSFAFVEDQLAEAVRKSFGGSSSSTSLLQTLRLAKQELLTQPYRQSAIINSCVKVTRRAVQQLRPKLTVGDGDGAEEDVTSELWQLMMRPNPTLSRRQFWGLVTTYYKLAGGCFLFLSRVQGEGLGRLTFPVAETTPGVIEFPDEMWLVREDLVQEVVDQKTGVVTQWEFDAVGGVVRYPAHAVVHLYEPDPANPLRGLGDLQAAHRSATVIFRAEAFDDALLQHGGRVSGHLETTGLNIGESQRRAIETSYAERLSKPSEHGKVSLLPSGMKFVPNNFSPVDMDFQNLRLWSRDAVMMVFGVTKPLLSITDDVNRANAIEAKRVFYENTIIPFVEDVAEAFREELIMRLGPEYAEHYLVFDSSGVAALREDQQKQIESAGRLMDRGVTLREASEAVGLEIDCEGNEVADRRFLISTLKPIEQVDAPPPTPSAPPPPSASPASPAAPADQAPPPPPPNAEIDAEIRAATARQVRIELRNQKRLSLEAIGTKYEKRLARASRDVLRQFLLAQRKKLRELAAHAGNSRAATNGSVVDHEHFDPETREWTILRGISQAEVDELIVQNQREWGEQLWARMKPILEDALLESAQDAADDLGTGSALSVRSPAVIEFLRKKEILLVEGPIPSLAQEVRRALTAALADSSAGGSLAQRVAEVLDELEDQMTTLLGRTGFRAQMIARTEVGAATNGARFEEFKAQGIEFHSWLSAGDELVPVRESHAIDGQTVRVGDPFTNGLLVPNDSGGPPEEVINCLPGDQFVSGLVLGASKAWYAGPVVEIEAEQGHRLTLTINHPVLTSRGFVRAGALREGDDVLCDRGDADGRLARRQVQDQQRPPTIEEVFDSLAAQGATRRHAPGRRDFYGDARFFKSQIEQTIAPGVERHLELMEEREAVLLAQGEKKLDLVLANAAARMSAASTHAATSGFPRSAQLRPHSLGRGAQSAPFDRLGLARGAQRTACGLEHASHDVAGRALLLGDGVQARAGIERGDDRRGVEAQMLRTYALRLGATADLATCLANPPRDRGGLHAQLATDLERGYPGRVAPHRVVALRLRHFEGPVFDLHTVQGYFAAGASASIICRNCRCKSLPELPE